MWNIDIYITQWVNASEIKIYEIYELANTDLRALAGKKLASVHSRNQVKCFHAHFLA